MTPFRLKVMLFMLPLLLPIGRVDVADSARESGAESITPPAIEYYPTPEKQPAMDHADHAGAGVNPAS